MDIKYKLRAPVHKPTEAIKPKVKYDRSQNDEELKEALYEYYILETGKESSDDTLPDLLADQASSDDRDRLE